MKNSNILIVDDEATIRELLEIELRSKVMSIHAAGTCSEALDLLEANDINFILCDIRNKESSGFELFEKLKAENSTGAKLVLMSGFTQAQNGKESTTAENLMLRPSITRDIENLIISLTEGEES